MQNVSTQVAAWLVCAIGVGADAGELQSQWTYDYVLAPILTTEVDVLLQPFW
jgi:hypothetical protein